MTTTIAVVLADSPGWGHMGGWEWGMAVFGWLFMTALIAGVGWAIWTSSRGPEAPATQTALNLLDERYARGEIDRDEYLERRADLEV